MKAEYLIITLFIVFVGVTSCGKDVTCECSETYTGASNNWTDSFDTLLVDVKKSDGESKCNELDESTTLFSETYEVNCEVK